MASRQLLCRFFVNGHCRDGPTCQFSHDLGSSVVVPGNYCWYFLQARCMYGDNCRFLHIGAADIVTSATGSVPPSPSGRESVTSEPFELMGSPPNTSTTNTCSSRSADTRQSSEDSGFEGDTNNHPTTTIAANTTTNNNHSCNIGSPTQTQSPTTTQTPVIKSYAQAALATTTTTQPTTTTTTTQDTTNAFDGPFLIPTTGRHRDVSGSATDETLKGFKPLPRPDLAKLPLCPYSLESLDGLCPLLSQGKCHHLHPIACEFCERTVLHPYDEKQQNEHKEECIREHEKEMELSFAIQRSMDKTCGICMDTVIEKEQVSERRFGILEKCNHIFCLSCIRKWRQTKQFDNRTIRACPECRVSSDFVIPSKYWYESKDEKDQLIESYKRALSTKPCKYFKQGAGECPFQGACFYLHQYPDGRKADLAPPRPRRQRQNQDGEIETWREMLLWNYLDAREDRHWLLSLNLDDIIDVSLYSDDTEDDDSDISDFGDNY